MKMRFPTVTAPDMRMIGASYRQSADVMNWLTLYRARAGRKGMDTFLGFRLMLVPAPFAQAKSR